MAASGAKDLSQQGHAPTAVWNKPFWRKERPDAKDGVDAKEGTDAKASPDAKESPDTETLIGLYERYEDVGTAARAQMITVANWLLALIVALLAFVAKEAFRLDANTEACREPTALGLLAAIVGLALCVLTLKVVEDYYDHISRNWMRATRCKYLVPDLYRIVVGDVVPDLTRGWPAEVASVGAFQNRPEAGDANGPNTRVRSLFNYYWWGAFAVGVVFLGALVLQFVLRVCPALPAVSGS